MVDWRNIELDPWSRNWDEDEVEETFKPRSYFVPIFYWNREMRMKLKENEKLNVKTLFIALGDAAVLFFHSYLFEENNPIIATLLLPEISLRDMSVKSTHRDPVCNIYQFGNDQTFLVLCQYEVSAERANAWTDVLFQHIQATEVFVFTSILDSQLRDVSEDKLTPPLLRKLETDAQRIKQTKDQTVVCPYLESPNLIDKGPAAVLSYCQTRNIPAALYLSLEEYSQLNPETLSAFEVVLKYILPNFPVEKHFVTYTTLIQLNTSKKNTLKNLYL